MMQRSAEKSSTASSRRRWLPLIIAIALIASGALLWRSFDPGVGLVAWVRSQGPTGALIYVAVYAAAVVGMVSGLLLTLAAGFLYGPIWGVVVVVPASLLGASVAFVLGRGIARGWIEDRVRAHARWGAVDAALGADGFLLVMLLRLSPVFPFVLLNYALGLTRVRFSTYLLASAIGMFPWTVAFVYAGSLATSVTELGDVGLSGGDGWTLGLKIAGAVATVLVAALAGKLAHRALKQRLDG